jgi:hypothetical protein
MLVMFTMIEGEWNIENAVELTEEAEKVWFVTSYTIQIWTQGFGFNKLNPLLSVYIIKHSLEMVLF